MSTVKVDRLIGLDNEPVNGVTPSVGANVQALATKGYVDRTLEEFVSNATQAGRVAAQAQELENTILEFRANMQARDTATNDLTIKAAEFKQSIEDAQSHYTPGISDHVEEPIEEQPIIVPDPKPEPEPVVEPEPEKEEDPVSGQTTVGGIEILDDEGNTVGGGSHTAGGDSTPGQTTVGDIEITDQDTGDVTHTTEDDGSSVVKEGKTVYWGTIPSDTPNADDIKAISNKRDLESLAGFEFSPGDEDDEGWCCLAYPTNISSKSPTFINKMNTFQQNPDYTRIVTVDGIEYRVEVFFFSFDPLPFECRLA